MTIDACVRRLGTKGFATAASLADALLASPEAVQPLLDLLVVDGLAASVAGAYRLTDAGVGRAVELATGDRDAWGVEPATAALDAFLALDRQVKDRHRVAAARSPAATRSQRPQRRGLRPRGARPA